MEVVCQRCAGLDVHKAVIVACVRLIENGKVNREVRSFDTTTAGLLALLAWLTESGCTQVAMEATGVYWKPVWNILSDGDFELIVANAAHIKNVPGRKTDVNDATWIADLVAHGLIKASFVPKQEFQELRSLLRARKQLVREQSSHVLRVQKTLEEANIKLDSVITDILGVSGRRMIEAMIDGEPLSLRVERKRTGWRFTTRGASHNLRVLTPMVAALSHHMIEKIPPDMSRFLLCPMPGLITAIHVEAGAKVEAGQPLAVVEAMKMENILRAEKAGVVKEVAAKPGDSLAVDAVILVFEAG